VKILVIGGGGREHALSGSCAKAASRKIWCAPGNGASRKTPPVCRLEAGDVDGLVQSRKLRPDLTVIGPELPLVMG